MKQLLGVVACWLALCGPAWGALTIEGDLKVAPYKIVKLSAKGADEKAAVVWDVDNEDKCDVEEVGGRLLLVAPPGTYKVKCRSILLDKDGKTSVETARATVTITGDVPPQPPVPPGPTPDPPGPTPGPAPIPLAGLRVLIVYEEADLAKYPKTQVAAMRAKSVWDYLNSKCPKGADGKTSEWRIWDADVNTAGDYKHWQDAMKRERKSLPWIIISTGKAGYEGPLPADTDKLLELLKKYGDTASKAVRKGKKVSPGGKK